MKRKRAIFFFSLTKGKVSAGCRSQSDNTKTDTPSQMRQSWRSGKGDFCTLRRIRKNLYIFQSLRRETVLFGQRSGTFWPEKRHFSWRKAPLLSNAMGKQLRIKVLGDRRQKFGKILTKWAVLEAEKRTFRGAVSDGSRPCACLFFIIICLVRKIKVSLQRSSRRSRVSRDNCTDGVVRKHHL